MSEDEEKRVVDFLKEKAKRDPRVRSYQDLFDEVANVSMVLAKIMIKTQTMHLIIADDVSDYEFVFEMQIRKKDPNDSA